VQPSRLRLRVRKNGLELSDSLFSMGSRINTEFSLGAQVKTGSNCVARGQLQILAMLLVCSDDTTSRANLPRGSLLFTREADMSTSVRDASLPRRVKSTHRVLCVERCDE